LNKKEIAFKDFNCSIVCAISFCPANIIGYLF